MEDQRAMEQAISLDNITGSISTIISVIRVSFKLCLSLEPVPTSLTQSVRQSLKGVTIFFRYTIRQHRFAYEIKKRQNIFLSFLHIIFFYIYYHKCILFLSKRSKVILCFRFDPYFSFGILLCFMDILSLISIS